MAGMETWGQVPKSQTDNELINEAIADAISDHEADPEAHQGEGESLQNHKSDETIDHPTESVVGDKYAPDSIKPSKLDMYNLIIAPQFESLNNWTHNHLGEDLAYSFIGGYSFECGDTSGDWCSLSPNSTVPLVNYANKNPMQDVGIKFHNDTYQTFYAAIGGFVGSLEGFGFKASNGKVYAFWRHLSTEYTEELIDITVDDTNRYRCQYIFEVGIEYYIDNQLLFTAKENLPVNTDFAQVLWFKLTTNQNAYKAVEIYTPRFVMDL